MQSSRLAAFQGQLNCDGAGLKTYGEHQPVHFGQKFLPRKKFRDMSPIRATLAPTN